MLAVLALISTGCAPPLTRAARRGQTDKIATLLQGGASINTTDKHGQTLLMSAAEKGHYSTCKFLIGKGVDVNARDNAGNSALAYAANSGSFEIVKLLLESGADPFDPVAFQYASNSQIEELIRTKAAQLASLREEAARKKQDQDEIAQKREEAARLQIRTRADQGRRKALQRKYGKVVTRKASLHLQDSAGNAAGILQAEITIDLSSLDINGNITLKNIHRGNRRPPNLLAYRPAVLYAKQGQFLIGFAPPPPDLGSATDFIVNAGEQKTMPFSLSERLIHGDGSGQTFDEDTEAQLLLWKHELIQGLIDGNPAVSVIINPNQCKGCEMYLEFSPR